MLRVEIAWGRVLVMCGRFTLTREEMEFASRFAGKLVKLFFVPRYNIAPTQQAAVVLV
jgi:putative SOS response-associated peptidase YedK